MSEQQVILVTENDEPAGTMGKMQAHREGLLHRAFSVFVFDKKGRMLLQQRALQKYHGAGLWSNACCSHPFPGEEVEAAARRRLQEELGFTTSLQKIFEFTYRAEVENNLVEHEFDHVFAGEYEGPLTLNQQEVADYTYQSMPHLKETIIAHPARFTAWFRLAFPTIETWWLQRYGAGGR
ncbi:isopentenyl-diphosphate Delta-isomerase [Paraflavisolibacter sp. H34]|uniref:isopentenyl-diphosphate Delta-isomerase n=1 Tax=Huijunlia imazamoxiresistens TaxID=3127457 RepID=UPI00301645F2